MSTTTVLRERSAKDADRTLVRAAGKTWTCSEFWSEVDELSAGLARCGVKKGEVVAVLAERSPELIALVLAIWRAGAVFMPVDPDYPSSRREFMLDDAAPSLRVGNGSVGWTEWAELRGATEFSGFENDPEDPAYLIYTSGSSGLPKGVLVPHRGIVNLAEAQCEAFAIDEGSVVLQFASPSFDAFISELVTALYAGAILAVPRAEDLRSLRGLREFVSAMKVSVATMPPSLLALLKPADMPSIRSMVSAGEACTAQVASAWVGHVRFINAYGPTECTVCTTMELCERTDSAPAIGRPMRGVECFVLDSEGNPTAAGQEGELYIAGVGVALGYHNRPELNAVSFVDLELKGKRRCYRTGDIVRQLPDGRLHFVRRADEQVKVSGYRIELSEVRAVLEKHPGIVRAAAFVRGESADAELCGFYECVDGFAPDTGAIVSHLAKSLPHYMIPSILLGVDEMPTTANGKLDRNALLSMIASAEDSEGDDPLGSIWCQTLGVATSPRDVDFWHLGGSSLKLLRLVERIEARFGQRLSLQAMLARPVTLDHLAALLNVGVMKDESAGIHLESQAGGSKAVLFPPVTGDPLSMLGLARRLVDSRPVVCLASPGFFAGEVVPDAAELARRYTDEIVSFTNPGESLLLVAYSAGAIHAFAAAGLLQKAGRVPRLLMIDGAAPQPEPITDPKMFSVPAAGFLMSVMLSFTRGEKPGLAAEALAAMSASQQKDAIAGELERLGLVAGVNQAAAAERRFRTYQANLQGVAQYVATPTELPILQVLSEQGHPFSKNPNVFNWQPYTGTYREEQVPGGHFNVLAEENLSEVVALIEKWAADE